MTVSILVPSRERPELLMESLRSLGDRDVEFLIRLDEDDPLLESYADIPHTIIGPGYGYSGLMSYYNELAARATGDWVMLWNDDCIMQTPDWVDVVAQYQGKLAVLNPNTNHDNWKIDMNVFPIIPRKIIELLGHMSLSIHVDSWLEFVGRAVGINVRVPITICHDRFDLTGNNGDSVYAGRRYESELFHSEGMARKRERDIEVIRAYLERNPEARPDPSNTARS